MKTQMAKLNYLRIAPRKVRLSATALKGLSVNEAEAQLLISPHRANVALLRLLRSAAANAKNNQQLNSENLFIKEIRVDAGPMLKRFIPRAMGRATPIEKKSSHITLILEEMPKIKQPRFKIVKPERISKRIKAQMAKEGKKEKKEKEIEKPKAQEKPGFMRRIFRRKSI